MRDDVRIYRLIYLYNMLSQRPYVENQYLPAFSLINTADFFISRMTKGFYNNVLFRFPIPHCRGDKNDRSILALHLRHA